MPSAAAYSRHLRALLPPGIALFGEKGSTLAKLLDGTADELARVDARAGDVIRESDPRTTVELLAAWERVLGLPNPCFTEEPTFQQRRDAVVAKVAGLGGQSRAFYIAVAAALGYEIGITEFHPFVAGSPAGDSLTNGDWIHTWRVDGPEVTVTTFKVGASTVGEPLRVWGNEQLECVMSDLKPAHTVVNFAYPQVADPAQSTATVPDGNIAEETTITVQAVSEVGNNMLEGGALVEGTITGANPQALVFIDNGDGTYTATYTPTADGTDSIAITLDGEAIADSPYTSEVAWLPVALFAASEEGAWYDPSDLSTMFQDSAGTTPVTAADQPVGLIQDKSGNGRHLSQATSAARPTLRSDGTLWWLEFDGVDDALAASAIDFTGTDKMTVLAGVRKLADANGVIIELSASWSVNSGTFSFTAGDGSLANYGTHLRGDASATQRNTADAAPSTDVVACRYDIGGATRVDEIFPRVNGVDATVAGTAAGVGNFGNHALYAGARGGTSARLSGHIFGLIVRGATTDLTTIGKAEAYMAAKAGVTL